MKFLSCLYAVALFHMRQLQSDHSGSSVFRRRNLTKTVLVTASPSPGSSRTLKKLLLAMKLTLVFITFGFLHLSAASHSQTVTLTAKNWPVDSVFSIVKKQTGFVFFCSKEIISEIGRVSVDANHLELNQFLQNLFDELPFRYSIKNKTIIVSRKSGNNAPEKEISFGKIHEQDHKLPPVSGIVRGRDGKLLSGASVVLKGTKKGVSTNASGTFIINADEGQTLVISYIGYKKREILIQDENDLLNIVLESDDENIQEVTINTGIIKKDKASFTGAAAVYTGAELKAIGNKNILESLKSLDPAFIKIENNLQGSNPNSKPNFEIRGQTTINTNTVNDQFAQDPNQPLFILNGFETTLDIIRDMDMNRVATITILKDAASTALFGSRAANGVIVVETKRPVPGKVQMSYNTDMSFEMPDLTSYNLMNAEEKLQFELLHGLYGNPDENPAWAYQGKYNQRLTEVRRGVNTYWLSEPLRTGLSQRQSLQFAGGNSDLMFNAGLSYGKVLGVMKGSSRESWGGNMDISYRKGNLNLNNMLNVTGTNAVESPYGSFADFANAIPYYRKTAPDGSIGELLDPDYEPTLMNPLYNASLFRINETKSFAFFNNLNIMYSLSNRFRLEGSLQLAKGTSKAVEFIPPEDTRFARADLTRKGSYAYNGNDNYSYSANFMASYGEVIGKSQLSAAVRGDVTEENSERRGFSAMGFPFGSDGNPMYAYGYTPFTVPTAVNSKIRSAGFLANFSYVWDRRFMLDATYRIDGATVFGSEKIFKPFGSVGLGWNIHQEPLLRGVEFINLLKVRANAGYNGNENLGQFTSVSTYGFQTGSQNIFGQGITVATLGNPFLDWQQTLQWSYGIDFGFWHNRISGYIDYFIKETDPLTVSTEGILPSSVGINSDYVVNVGHLRTKGWQVSLRIQPINIPSQRILWTIGITGSGSRSTYGGLEDRLAKLDEEQRDNKGMLRFRDGYGPNDLWAVISRGVDPATGNELYQKKDGTLSFIYNTDDIMRIGDARPKAEGRINTSFTFKELTVSATMAYRVGGYTFNSALYSRVENITNPRFNLDKRALSSRWQQPGDVTQFTNIRNTFANLTSRFIQEDNQIIGESFSLSWRTYGKWLQNLRAKALSITMYVNDIFRFEKIKTERGINYPYARTASLSLSLSF